MNKLSKVREVAKTMLFLAEIEEHNQYGTPVRNINSLAQNHKLDKTKPKTLIDSGFVVKNGDVYSVTKPINYETVSAFLNLQSAKKKYLKHLNSFKHLI
ncbi:MAG: hypothetical protein PHX54_12340 [Lentimicrobiaceae bacterium]|nr:hypothetical protein [Lentimicrobiaceae bacterium]